MRGIEIVRTHRPLSRDGVYTIFPDLRTNRTVFCDITTDGGGWTGESNELEERKCHAQRAMNNSN